MSTDTRMPDGVRLYRPADRDAVIALWQACSLTRPWNDPGADIDRALENPTSVLLVHDDDVDQVPTVTGVIMAGYDGHRGWMYYLGTDPDRRGQGIARRLVAAAETVLRDLGCPKVELMVRSNNHAALGFYDGLGYTDQQVTVRAKWLITPPADDSTRG